MSTLPLTNESPSPWLLQLPAMADECLYARSDLQLIEERRPMRRHGEQGIATVQTRRHLCVPEGLRLLSETNAGPSPPVDSEYLSRLRAAIATVAGDEFFSSQMGCALPLHDVYAWPAVVGELAPAVAIRARWLENMNSKARAEKLRRAMAALVSEVSLCGLIPLDDTSDAVVSGGVVCKRFRAEASGESAGLGEVLVSSDAASGSSAECSSMWSMSHCYQRRLVSREEIPALIKTVGGATAESVCASLSALVGGGANGFSPLSSSIGLAAVTPLSLLSLFPEMQPPVLSGLLAAASTSSLQLRWYLRTGVALSVVCIRELVVVPRAALSTLTSAHFRGRHSPLSSDAVACRVGGPSSNQDRLTWGEALASGLVICRDDADALAGQSNESVFKYVRSVGVLSAFAHAKVTCAEAVAAEFSLPLATKITLANNYFFVIHGHGVGDGVPLPKDVLPLLDASASQVNSWI